MVPIIIGAAVVVVVVAVGGYLVFGRSSTKSYSDDGMNFAVSSFKCGGKDRTVVEGPQGPVAHPTHVIAKGEWCVLEASVTMNLTGEGATSEVKTFTAENQQLVDASGSPLKVSSADLETITPPSNYYQPGPDPSIEPKKSVDVRVSWDYDTASTPAAAILHADAGSTGARVPVAGKREAPA